MRKIFLLLSIIITANIFAVYAQRKDNEILLTIDDKAITKQEFIRIYEKNKNIAQQEDNKTKESIDDYLQRFINFKLKVIEAERMGMDTTESFRKELNGYRSQLAKSYFVDESVVDSLIQEAYNRMKYEVNASHILIRVASTAAPKDTLEAYNKALSAYKRIKNGEDFETVAKEVSEDQSVKQNGGNLGYFSAFRMIYPFESAAYNTKKGEVSMPFRTQFGYHVIQVNDRRDSRGKVKVAHIMVRVPQGTKADSAAKFKAKIEALYDSVKAGAEFSQIAKKYSDDRRSANNGGELQWFGTGRMVPAFEKAAFGLNEKGNISEPIRSPAGWHILQLIDRKGIPEIEEIREDIKRKISSDARASMSKEVVIERLKDKYNFTQIADLQSFYNLVDTSIFKGTWKADSIAGKLTKNLFTIGDRRYTELDFARYLEKSKLKRRPEPIIHFIDKQYEKFVNDKVIEFEDSRLEENYPEFKYLMQEYHDGILLFELTDEKVWSKAMKDTTGLQKYYEKHKNNYMWDKRIEATIYELEKPDAEEDVMKLLDKKVRKGWDEEKFLEKINRKDTLVNVKETKKFSQGDNQYIDEYFGHPEKQTVEIIGDKDLIIEIHRRLDPMPKTLEEARGLVTADYQDFLEKKWLEELHGKYKIEVNKNVLSTIKN